MKKFLIAFVMALLALAFVAVPVLADGGNASVTCSDITVTDDSPPVGTTITFYGTVTIVANASSTTNYYRSYGWGSFTDRWAVASAESYAWYEIRDPEGNLVASDSNTESDYDEAWRDWWSGYNTDNAYADAGQTFDWDATVDIDLVGDYTAEQGGTVTVYYGNYSQTAYWTCWGWVWDEPVPNTTILTAESEPSSLTVLAHSNAPLSTGRTRPILTVLTPVDSELFFTSDGWGDPTSDVIVHNDGIWQVEIADGTRIMLDGEWHRKTWIEVDDQGNVIGRYGYDGHIIATEIGLSSPIKVTKVG
jgi:hypothetical protein